MSTKLEKPIELKIETVEEAIYLHSQAIGDSRRVEEFRSCNMATSALIRQEMLQRGINIDTWQPPTPLKFGQHDVTANPDGSLTVGCTTESAENVEKIVNAWRAARKPQVQSQPEPEWPKFLTNGAGYVLKCNNDHDLGMREYSDPKRNGKSEAFSWKERGCGLTQITRAEAEKIIGRRIE